MLEKSLLEDLKEFIDVRLNQSFLDFIKPSESMERLIYSDMSMDELDDFIKVHHKPSLKEMLFIYIDKKNLSDPEVYSRAGLDRRHFSKIRSNPNYLPKKNTVIALALALELNEEETDELLGSAGYSLSDSDTSDLVIQYFLQKEIYDLHQVNLALDYFSLKPL